MSNPIVARTRHGLTRRRSQLLDQASQPGDTGQRTAEAMRQPGDETRTGALPSSLLQGCSNVYSNVQMKRVHVQTPGSIVSGTSRAQAMRSARFIFAIAREVDGGGHLSIHILGYALL